MTIWNGAGEPAIRAPQRVEWDEDAAERGGYETFMLKEIHEQPSALWDTIGDRLRPDGSVSLEGLGMDDATLARVERVHVVACGTSYHAGLVGRYLIEDWARIPVHVEVASEYRYRTCLAGPGDLVLGITQSGETADTLAAMRVARERGAHVVAVTNIMGSQSTRDADGVLYTRAGLEIGVAATKTHTAQVMALALLALKLGRLRWALTEAGTIDLAHELRRLPDAITRYLAGPEPGHVAEVAARYADCPFFLYLGRHVGVPVCFEGALKLKEISYIPTEAYPAGEMKHGPIALLDDGSPVVVVATDGHVFDKVVSNIQEVRARGAKVIAVATEGNEEISQHADDVLWAPRSPALLSPVTVDRPAAALRLRDGPAARPERGPAAQPGQDRYRRVEGEVSPAAGPSGSPAGRSPPRPGSPPPRGRSSRTTRGPRAPRGRSGRAPDRGSSRSRPDRARCSPGPSGRRRSR